jgi:hypothetical protein
MADYRTSLYDAVDRYFDKMRGAKDHFADDLLEDPTPYELPMLPIQPSGWVENADPDIDGGASVTIDSDGITILNGKLTVTDSLGDALITDGVVNQLENESSSVVIDADGITITDGALTFLDNFGATVLDGAGFGATWLDFLDSGRVYNAAFTAGSTNAITAATVSSGADSDADYAASLSADLPYWIVNSVSGAGTLARTTSVNSPSGFCLKWTGVKNGSVFQDIPISPGQAYGISWLWKYTNSSSGFSFISGYEFRDKSHALIGSIVEQSLPISTTQSSYEIWNQQTTTIAPQNARYIRVYVSMTWSSGSPTIQVAKVILNDLIHEGDLAVPSGRILLGQGLGIGFAESATDAVTGGPDFELVWETNNSLALNPYGFSAGLRIRNDTDLSMSSTNHALTLGNDASTHMALDGNEIQVRSGLGGTAAALNLNKGGGDIQFASTSNRVTITDTGNLKITNGYIQIPELSPVASAADTNTVRLYADDSAGVTRLRAVFSNGTRVTLATG